MQQLLETMLSADPEIEVVGTAPDPIIAREKIKALNPDVITLDVEMPHMNGLEFLRKIMTLRPMPVVMVSSMTQEGADTTLAALEIGAVDFFAKPKAVQAQSMMQRGAELAAKVKAAARAKLGKRVGTRSARRKASPSRRFTFDRTVLIGASTGGVEALGAIITHLPANAPSILITQHMPEKFTTAFAERLNRISAVTVKEAQHRQLIEQGTVYLAPGSHHLKVARQSGRLVCELDDGPTVTGHRPSVDVLFRSAARVIGDKAVGIILTGMGKDGADGLLEMRRAGAFTLGQDEETSLIYGMPRVAFERGGVARQLPLQDMVAAILEASGASELAEAKV